MDCPRCDARVADGANYCTTCGLALHAADRPEDAGAAARGVRTRLIGCPRCLASNALSRTRCGRCGAPLDAEQAPGCVATVPESGLQATHPGVGPAARGERESARLIVGITTLAAVAVIAVTVSIVNARAGGSGPGEPRSPGDPTELAVTGARASSELPAAGSVSYAATNLIDGDPATAWNEGAPGQGEGEWVTLTLAAPATVNRVVVWNGYQKGPAFLEHPRVRTLAIELGDAPDGERRFEVELLDVRGAQAVDLPESVTTTTVRLEIVDTYRGGRYADTALSEVEILGPQTSSE